MSRTVRVPIFVWLALAPIGAEGAPDSAGSNTADTLAARAAAVPADTFSVIYRLEEIVVYGRRPRDLSLVTELRGEQIGARGGGDIAHTLRLEPALLVTSGAKAETETRIRGFPASSVLVLVDGRPINTGYYGKTDLSMISSADIAAVQVVKGPASTAYGPNGMGGVINVITRSGLDEPGSSLGARFGDNGLRRLSLGHGGSRGRLRYRLSAYEQYRDGFPLSGSFEPTSIEDGGTRMNSGYHKAGGSIKTGYERVPGDLYTLTLDYNRSRREIPPTIYSWDAPHWRRFPEWVRYGASLSNERRLGGRFDMTAVLYADAQEDRLIEYSGPSMSEEEIEFDSKLENLTAGGSASVEGEVSSGHRVHAGIAFKYDGMDKKPDLDEPWVAHSITTGSAFVEDRFAPWTAATFTAGAQGAYYATESGGSARGAFLPTIALRQTLPWKIESRAAYSRAIRFPTLHALYSETSGNPGLRPETADKFEVGLERWLIGDGDRHLAVEASWFRNELEDLIYRPASSQQYRNVLESVLTGVEATLRVGWSERLTFEAGYVWIDRGASTAEIMEELSPHRLGLAATAQTRFGTRVRYDFSVLGERTTFVPGLTLAPYRYHGITLSQEVGGGLTLRVELFNLTDASYEEELGYPAPGRQFSAGFDWRI
ncbi:MAG: TonB-dependent receptor [Candidatus Krumholzibacteria bacterium]|nr:TonB-dependent receptor [Candidatus Krumholzibacteria bacterium]